MKRFILAGLAVMGVCGTLTTEPVAAQGVNQRAQLTPFARPTISPYLNLARGGSSTVNYYGLIRPQQDTARALQMLQQPGSTVAPFGPTAEEPSVPVVVTGHPTHFGNYGHYFPTNAGRTGLPTSTGLGRR